MQPTYLADKFKCPHCKTLATQTWLNNANASQTVINIYQHLFLNYRARIQEFAQRYITEFLEAINSDFESVFSKILPKSLGVATCNSCQKITIWVDRMMVYPRIVSIALPNEDMPKSVKSLYIEASNIFQDSPKGASALLRLSIQNLMTELGQSGKNINSDIKSLVEAGLDSSVQMALDYCRVVGNNAVHPGEINLDDEPEIASMLFEMLNFIVDERISKPKKIQSMFNKLPQGALDAIAKRDGKT